MQQYQPIRTATVLAAALAAGVTGDILLRATPWGINFTLWTAASMALLVAVARRLEEPLPAGYQAVTAGAVLAGAMLSVRDAADLGFWNAVAAITGVGLVAARTRTGTLIRSGITEAAGNLFLQLMYCFFGPLMLGFTLLQARKEGWTLPKGKWTGALRGVAIAIPVLILFGSLLISADAGFEYLIKEILHIDLATIVSHILLTGLLTWTAAGFLYWRFLTAESMLPAAAPLQRVSLGLTETAIVLGALDLLFAAFVALQIPYFFGGDGAVLGDPALTYAEYARRGFFELITVAAITLPLLLAAEWMLRKDEGRSLLILRMLSGITIGLLLVMLASAAHRLWLYASAYGLTSDRVHAAAVLAWLACTFLWFGATVLRGKRDRFLFGAVLGAYAGLLALNLLGPDALVAKVNLDRYASTGTFDTPHATRLGAEAVPHLLDGLAALPAGDRDVLARNLLLRYDTRAAERGWRSWNYALGRAERLVQERREELRLCLLPQKNPQNGR